MALLVVVADLLGGPSLAPTPSADAATVASVAAFGDSVPSGAACRCTPFPHLVAARRAEVLDEGAAVARAANLARSGQTSAGLLRQLRGDGGASLAAISGADVTLVTIGANDFDEGIVTRWSCSPAAGVTCYQPQLTRLRTTLTQILTTIVARKRPGGVVLVTGYWNVFKDGAVGRSRGRAYVRNSDALTRKVNALVADVAARTGARYVDIYAPFKGTGSRDATPLLAADGDHPNAAGHRVIADALVAALQRR